MRDTNKSNSRGGRRTGAGRKRSKQNLQDPKHVTREALDCRHPVHVMLRTREDVPRLRQRAIYHAIRRVLAWYLAHDHLRVIHISIQHNHIHMIVESTNRESLTTGMQSFAIRCARAINRAWGRQGKVFKFRYKAKQIRTRSYARNAIAYVLNNYRRHREDVFDRDWQTTPIDTYSSGPSFTGWSKNPQYKPPRGYAPLPVSAPRTSLLKTDWQWHGLIGLW